MGNWQETGTYESHAYAAHWDGLGFTQTPIDGFQSPRLFDVDGAAPDDAWTVGFERVGRGFRTLALHWDGATWTEVRTPTPEGTSRYLLDVDVIAPDDVWAVGLTQPGRRPLALHWDGESWKNTGAIAPAPESLFSGVGATAHNRVWAVGSSGNGSDALIERWNGTRWRVFDIADTANATVFDDVSAVSGRQAWAVGTTGRHPVIYRWRGEGWRPVVLPTAPGTTGGLTEVASLPDGTSMAAGTADGRMLELQRCAPA